MTNNSKRAELLLNQVSNMTSSTEEEAERTLSSLPQDHHILSYCWTIWHHSRSKPVVNPAVVAAEEDSPAVDSYLQTTNKIWFANVDSHSQKDCNIVSVEQLWASLSSLKNPFELPIGTEFLIFKSGVNPVWEDPINAKGGRWVFRFSRRSNNSNNNSSKKHEESYSPYDLQQIRKRTTLIWERLVLRTLGGSLIPESSEFSELLLNDISGLVLSVRKDEDIISIWNSNVNFSRKKEDEEMDSKKKKLTSFVARRIICDSILRVVRECDTILAGEGAIDTIDSGSNERVNGVSFEYRLHSDNSNTYPNHHHHNNSSHNNLHNNHTNSIHIHNNNNSHNNNSNSTHTKDHHRSYNRRFNKYQKEDKADKSDKGGEREKDFINSNESNFLVNLGNSSRSRREDDGIGLLSFGKRRLQQQREKEGSII